MLTTRREMIRLAGIAGLSAAAAACSNNTDPHPAATARSAATTPSVAPSEPPPLPVPVVPAVPMLCREAWGAQPALPGGTTHTITRMTIHHTAAVLGDNRNIVDRLRQHQQLHQGQHGWIDIAYHVAVDRNGNIFELRAPDLVGDTATSYDPTGHFLVVCEGDFNEESVTEAQLHGSALAFAWAAQRFNVATDTLSGHRDFAATECPGENLYAHVASGDLKRRIDALMSSGSVDLQRICGPDAAAVVARIEMGG